MLSQVHHAGGSAVQAVQRLNLNGAENGITYPVAQLIGGSADASRCCSCSTAHDRKQYATYWVWRMSLYLKVLCYSVMQ